MADGIKIDQPLAKRMKAATIAVENWRNPKNGRQYPRNPQDDSPLWYNNSGETAPPFAAFEVSDVDIVGGRIVLQGIKPTGTAGKAIFFNFRESVPAAENGVYQPGPIFRARFSNGTGANAVSYGPVASSWELSTAGTGFESCGKIDDETNDMLARSQSQFERVKMIQTGGADGTASTQATWTYSIKNWAETVTYATNVDPTDAATEPGGIFFRPALGSLEPATEGYAMFVGGEPFIVSCNEGESVAPCTTAGGLSITESTSLRNAIMLGGM